MTSSKDNHQVEEQLVGQSLVDRLIDSQLEWRQLIREANGGSLGQLSEQQIKRQEVIHELIQTERHHCLTLALMRQVYLAGLRQLNESRLSQRDQQAGSGSLISQCHHSAATGSSKQHSISQDTLNNGATSHCASSISHHQQPPLNSDLIDLERLFPALEDLIQAHELFFAHLRLLLVDSCQALEKRKWPASQVNGEQNQSIIGVVGPIGELLCDQFRLRRPAATGNGAGQPNSAVDHHIAATTKNGSASTAISANVKQQPANGQKILQAYGKFCGQHYDSSRYYKHLMQTDKGFKQFIEHCNKQNASCRQRGIPECNLLVTQRLTKYPLLIEQLIKTSKEEPGDEEAKLREALAECKGLLNELNGQLARKESFERLLDIYAQFSPKSYTIYNRHLKFTKHDLLQHKRLRQLIHSDGQIRIWSATRRKLFQVLCLVLNDIVVFLRIEPSSGSGDPTSERLATSAAADQSLALDSPDSLPLFEYQQQQLQQQTSGSLLGLGLTGSSHHLNYQQHPSANLGPIGAAIPASSLAPSSSAAATSTTGSGFSVKYYFANIDNKPSVISLSKLLVREKAATDDEPRIYLISSSPRQPEMYELAFLSKRHQSTFVDRLKASVELHNRSIERQQELADEEDDNEEEAEGEDEDYDYVDYENYHALQQQEVEEPEVQQPLACGHLDLNGSSCCCSSGQQCSACGRRHQESDQDYDEEEEEDNDEDYGPDPEAHDSDDEDEIVEYGADHDGEAEDQEELDRKSTSRFCRDCHPQPEVARSSPGKLSSEASAAGDLDFDIEQDVIPEPQQAARAEEQQQVSYATAETCASGQCRRRRGESLSPQGDGGLRRADSESLKEIGLAGERAKDSLDEGAPSKQKLRGGNRRRRAQRPRNISNQSSSSSEAAHRQAIQLISSGAAGSCCATGTNTGTAKSSGTTSGTNYEEEFDSGRGHDDSSSSASTSSNSLGSRDTGSGSGHHQSTGSKESSGCQKLTGNCDGGKAKKKGFVADLKLLKKGSTSGQQLQRPLSPAAGNLAGQSASCRVTSAASGSCNAACAHQQHAMALPKSATGSCKSNLTKCSSILGKSSCSFMKQRKLSTVSTMSSQLKLISKLKSGLQDQPQRMLPPGTSGPKQQVGGQSCSGGSCCCSLIGSRQSTLSKQVRQQMRRSSFIPEQKLEELRDLRIQLDKDKQEWQEKFDRMQEQLLNERRELDLAREKLKSDRQQVANEREQLYRKLDVLKEKGILLSPSHKVIITAPELRIYPPNGSSESSNNNHNSGQYMPKNLQQQQQYLHHQQHLSQLQHRQQVHYGEQQHRLPPLNQVNHHHNQEQNLHSSSIQIVTAQRHTNNSNGPGSQQQQIFALSGPMSSGHNHHLLSFGDHFAARGQQQQPQQQQLRQSTTNLFIQSAKVPLHLSEGGGSSNNTGSGSISNGSQQQQQRQVKQSSSSSLVPSSAFNLMGKVSSGGNLLTERLCSSTSSVSKFTGLNLESHVI